MEYKDLTKEFRTLFFKLNSIKNTPEQESVKLAFYGVNQASKYYSRKIEANGHYRVGSEILFIKENKEMITTKSGNRVFKVKSYNYMLAEVRDIGEEKIQLKYGDRTSYFNYSSVFGVGCWMKSAI